MPLLGIVISAVMVGFVLGGITLVAGLIWTGFWLVKSRHLRGQSPKIFYLRLFSGLALLAAVVFLVIRETYFPAPPSGVSKGYVDIGSSALTPFQSMYAVSHARYGFTPLPKSASVDIEQLSGADAKTAGYDVLLHIYPNTENTVSVERTVSFKRVKNKYQWIGEQEMWTGPHRYKLPDGSSASENISISYATQPGLGLGLTSTLQILYAGDDSRLSGRENLQLKDIKPVLKEWGAL